MFEKDYIIRLINEIARVLAKLVLHKETGEQELEEAVQAEYGRLLELLEAGNINEAENQLLEELDADNPEHFKMALLFYMQLNDKDDDFLTEHNYTREEIAQGLSRLSAIYGYQGVADVFLKEDDI